jgi:hypothetical protein
VTSRTWGIRATPELPSLSWQPGDRNSHYMELVFATEREAVRFLFDWWDEDTTLVRLEMTDGAGRVEPVRLVRNGFPPAAFGGVSTISDGGGEDFASALVDALDAARVA